MSTSPFTNPFDSGKASDTLSGKEQSSGKPAGNLDHDDILKAISSDDEPEPKKKVEEVDDDDDKEVKIDKEEKPDIEDDEEDTEDKIELKEDNDEEEEEKLEVKKDDDKNIDTPPRKKAILDKYPEFFKEFPFFDKMMFRDKAYSEMFGSFDEAKEVYNKVERLNEFETQLFDGDSREILKSLKESNPKAFDKVVDSYLKQLYDVDPDAYKDVTDNFAKQIITGMAAYAKKKGDAEVDKAARVLYEFLYDEPAENAKIEFKVRSKVEENEESKKIEQERAALISERFETARDGLTKKVDNVLKATIADYIDPRGQMTAYEKKNAISETLNRLHSKVAEDTVFKKNLDKLWKASFGEKFSENSLNSIKKSYLGKASRILSSVIKEVHAEVLKDNRSKGKEKEEDKEEPTRQTTKNVNAGRPHQQNNKAKEFDPRKNTVEEFFSND